jgi:hypothetical protein
LYDSDSKASKEDKEKSSRKPRHCHGAKSHIARRKEQFLWNLAFCHCLHPKAKLNPFRNTHYCVSKWTVTSSNHQSITYLTAPKTNYK